MDFGGPYLQHFSYRQALNSDIGPIGCYCPLPFNPDFGHSKSKMNTEHVMMLTNNQRDIAVYIDNYALVNRLIIGDPGVNTKQE